MQSLKKLYSFLEETMKESTKIEVEESDYETLGMFLTGDIKKFEKLDATKIAGLKEKYGVNIAEDHYGLLYLGSTSLRWKRPEQKPEEGFLSGGFAFNDINDIYKFKTEFWQKSLRKLEKLGAQELVRIKDLESLRWFESPTPVSEAEYSPQFGCVKLRDGELPDDFYYYDSGILYHLPFKSFDEYISAMVDSAAVRCWQYFYIDQKEIIKKNRGLNYATWSLHINSKLESGITDLEPRVDAKSDRLDLINEYLQRCILLLPDSFPFLDFSQMTRYYKRFEEVYNRERSK